MPKNNNLINLVKNKKPVELVQELEKYEIKKSPLSVAARSKVINKSGSGYISESKGDYGPCEYWDCPHSINCRFYVKIGFSGGGFHLQKLNNDRSLSERWSWITMENIQQARNVLNGFEKGGNEVGGYMVWEREFSSYPSWERNTLKEDKIKGWLHDRIKEHEAGMDAYIARKDFYSGGCSSVIM